MNRKNTPTQIFTDYSLLLLHNDNVVMATAHPSIAMGHLIEGRCSPPFSLNYSMETETLMKDSRYNFRHLSGWCQAVPADVFKIALDLLKPPLNTKDWLKLNQNLNIDMGGYMAA